MDQVLEGLNNALSTFQRVIRGDLGQGKGRFRTVPLAVPDAARERRGVRNYYYFFKLKKNS